MIARHKILITLELLGQKRRKERYGSGCLDLLQGESALRANNTKGAIW